MQPKQDWVVRGGIADWETLQDAYVIDDRVDPPVYGFSVQYAPDMNWDQLVRAGQLRNGQVCYAERKKLEEAVHRLGYTMLLVVTPGQGYHHELSLVLAQGGRMLTELPEPAARALSEVFQEHRVKNPLKP